MKNYKFKELVLFIWDMSNSLEGIAKIEDYIFDNVKAYNKNEISCMITMIEVRINHIKNPI